jgi:hypothetical protein
MRKENARGFVKKIKKIFKKSPMLYILTGKSSFSGVKAWAEEFEKLFFGFS